MKIKDIPKNIRPRERFLEVGPSNLTDQELLAILIKTGSKNSSVLNVSLQVLKLLDDSLDVSINDLTNIRGIGKVKAIEILSLLELSKRLYLKKESKDLVMRSAKDIYEFMRYELYDKKQEYFYTIYFDNRMNFISKKLHFVGTINKSVVHPREIFKEAYKVSASSIVCIHNHPSGNITPSKEDIHFTKKLVEIGKLNNIYINDHVIITNNNYFSFYDNDLM